MNARLLLATGLALRLFSCSSAPPSPLDTGPPSADFAPRLEGVQDRGADPAVVLLDLGGDGFCTGALLAADVVLTARRCVAITGGDAPCPEGAQLVGTRDLTTIRVLLGEDAASAVERARGRAAVLPDGDVLCGADLALLLLDSTIDDVAPFTVSPTGAAMGDHVRSVAYANGAKRVRDHVLVAATSSRELSLAEAPCAGTPGGPALDETSGVLVGVLSRGGPSCDALDGYDVDTRADAFLPLVAQALAEGDVSHAAHQAREKKGPVDVGASCTVGDDCAAGVCAEFAAATYCTRTCTSTDRCPSTYRCTATTQGPTVCIQD